MGKLRRLLDIAIVRHVGVPLLLYAVLFLLFTQGSFTTFLTHLWGNDVDGVMSLWNLNWTNLATLRPGLYPSIWHTNLLYWPSGTSLVGHDLGPFNGFLALLLRPVLSLRATSNAIMIFSFAASGLTAYLLAFHFSRSMLGSLVGGFVFTFSSYHFAHAASGHMNLVAMEWLPLFVLCWYMLITRPTAGWGAASAIVLWLVLLSNMYYFLYAVLAGVIIAVWHAAVTKRPYYVLEQQHRIAIGLFLLLCLILIAPIVGRIFLVNSNDPLTGTHRASDYPMDLLAPFIPGGSWLFSEWTRPYWQKLAGNVGEASLHIALPVYILLVFVTMRRTRFEEPARESISLWPIMMAAFAALALGPVLRVSGDVVWTGAMPYSLLEAGPPVLRLSGVPSRMMIMAVLAAVVPTALGIRELLKADRRTGALTALVLAILVFESLPARMPALRLDIPEYVNALADLPDNGSVLDLDNGLPGSAGRARIMYYQTVFQKPLAFGYLSRLPASVKQRSEQLGKAIQDWDYRALREDFDVGYVVSQAPIPPAPPDMCLTAVFRGENATVYRLDTACP